MDSDQLYIISAQLDAPGPAYRFSDSKQQRTEDLLAQRPLTDTQEKELAALLQEANEVMLRRAYALGTLPGVKSLSRKPPA